MPVRILWIAAIVFGVFGPAFAEEGTGLMGEIKPPPAPIRFYGELGFRDFLKHEPSTPPPYPESRIPRVQRNIVDLGLWKERTFPKFAVHVTATEYYFGQNFGRNLIGRFFKEGYGAEVCTYLHLDEGLDFFVAFDWALHREKRADLAGVRTKLSDFRTYALLLGIKPYSSLQSLIGIRGLFFRNASANIRFGLGGTFMESVRKLEPLPEDWFWNARTLGTIHITLGFKYRFFEGFYIFADNGVRMYTPPNPSHTMRPDNETGPFVLFVWQMGVFLRFH